MEINERMFRYGLSVLERSVGMCRAGGAWWNLDDTPDTCGQQALIALMTMLCPTFLGDMVCRVFLRP
jgi:hypothetical protein